MGQLAARKAVCPLGEACGNVGVVQVMKEEVELNVLDFRMPMYIRVEG